MSLAGVSLSNFLKIGVMAVLFIVAFKALAVKSNIPGLQSLAGAI
ncbi:MAG TPA: hypothetical protein VFR97_04980 [Capillimicrobium sp.]|nr:hypothetical protein [Capillimicrobium sp.]